MMRIRVSELDQVRWYRILEDMTAADLAARLRGEVEQSRQMAAGTAWHAVLENPPEEPIETIERDGFLFDVACDAEIELPQVREIRAERVYWIDGIPVTLTGGCDGITGSVVTDHKLTARPDAEKYFDSFQWRAYLDIYDADVFEYVLYHAKDDDSVIRILGVHPFRLYRYPGMREDVERAIRDFIDFVRIHVPERMEPPEAVPGCDDIGSGLQPEHAA